MTVPMIHRKVLARLRKPLVAAPTTVRAAAHAPGVRT